MISFSIKIIIFCIIAAILYAALYPSFSVAEAAQTTNSGIDFGGILAAIHLFASIGLAGVLTEKIT